MPFRYVSLIAYVLVLVLSNPFLNPTKTIHYTVADPVDPTVVAACEEALPAAPSLNKGVRQELLTQSLVKKGSGIKQLQ